MILPEVGRVVPLFTDKGCAEKLRLHFLNQNKECNFNIVALTFAEIAADLLNADGAIIDNATYAYVLPKEDLEKIKNQMDNNNK